MRYIKIFLAQKPWHRMMEIYYYFKFIKHTMFSFYQIFCKTNFGESVNMPTFNLSIIPVLVRNIDNIWISLIYYWRWIWIICKCFEVIKFPTNIGVSRAHSIKKNASTGVFGQLGYWNNTRNCHGRVFRVLSLSRYIHVCSIYMHATSGVIVALQLWLCIFNKTG